MIIENNIYLRAVEASDIDLLKNWRNIDSFRANFREHRELNTHLQKKWFEQTTDSKNDYMFVIVDRTNDDIVGACGLLYVDWIARTADFSFYIGKNESYIDDKYAPDATKALLRFGFDTLNLNKIWMELYSFDTQKISFFKENFNFNIDGRLRENCFEKGQYHDSFIISLLEKEYRLLNI